MSGQVIFIIKGIVLVAFFIYVSTVFFGLRLLYYKLSRKKQIIKINMKTLRNLVICSVIGIVIQTLFYMPKVVIPDEVECSRIEIEYHDEKGRIIDIELKDIKIIKDCMNNLWGLEGRRSIFLKSSTLLDRELAFIDIFSINTKEFFFIVVDEDSIKVQYNGFMYKVQDRNGDLSETILNFIRDYDKH